VALAARNTAATIPGATPSRTRMMTSPIAISIGQLPAQGRTRLAAWSCAATNGPSTTLTGVKVLAAANGTSDPATAARSSRRHPNSCCGIRPACHLGDDDARCAAFQDDTSLDIPREPPPSTRAGYNLDPTQAVRLALGRRLKRILVLMFKPPLAHG
jgi:hypothetical protein